MKQLSRRSRFAVITLVGLAVWAALLPGTIARADWIFSWDSAAYIETARSILDGQGFKQRVIDGLGDALVEPITWWPPGYSILIALMTVVTGMSVQTSGLLIAALAAACSVLLVTAVCMRLFDWQVALLMTLTIVMMPAFLQISSQYMSDSLFFAVAAASILCLLVSTMESPAPARMLIAAGFFAGASWAVRYVGSALLASTCAFILLHVLWLRVRDVASMLGWWLAGVAICFAPLALRNIISFGQLNPYNMPPSELTLADNVRRIVTVLLREMSTLISITNRVVEWPLLPLVLVLGLLILGALAFGARTWSGVVENLQRRRFLVFLAGYVLTYMTVVVIARTTYRWGELIDRRHVVQIVWLVWIGLALSGTAALHRLGVSAARVRTALLTVFALAAAVQLQEQVRYFVRKPATRVTLTSLIGAQERAYLAQDVPRHQIVLSTRADLLRLEIDLNARKLPPVSQYDFLAPITRDDLRYHGDRGFLWGVVIEDMEGALRGDYDALVRELALKPEAYPEFERVDFGGPGVVLKYRRPIETP